MSMHTKVPARRSRSRSRLALPVDIDRITQWATSLLAHGARIGTKTLSKVLSDPKVWPVLAKAVAKKDPALAARVLWPLVQQAATEAITGCTHANAGNTD